MESATESTQNGVANAATPTIQSSHPESSANKDVTMADAPVDQAASPMPQTADSPAPARTGTPAQASRAPSAHPDPGFTVPPEALPNGDATRRYLNTRVTGALLEGMKMLAKEQPDDPLRVLGEFLLQKSKELEGSS